MLTNQSEFLHLFDNTHNFRTPAAILQSAGKVQKEQLVPVVGGTFKLVERKRPEGLGDGGPAAHEGRIQQREAPIQVDD